MKRKLGVCTWIFGDMPLAEVGRRLRALDYDGVELAGDLDHYGPAEAAAILGEAGLEVFSLTPADVDLAHPDPTVRQEAIDYHLRLLDFAAELGGPLVACHGYSGRLRAVSTTAQEWGLLVAAVAQVAARAEALGLRLALEVMNRYETHLVNTAAEAVRFVDEVGAANVGILLDAFHMNIEEPDPAGALALAGERLWLYHVADSNRQGVGRGHTDFAAQLAALDGIGYAGPMIVECSAPGPDPFAAIKGPDSRQWLETYLRESRTRLQALERGH